jgi:hypothetical protein
MCSKYYIFCMKQLQWAILTKVWTNYKEIRRNSKTKSTSGLRLQKTENIRKLQHDFMHKKLLRASSPRPLLFLGWTVKKITAIEQLVKHSSLYFGVP